MNKILSILLLLTLLIPAYSMAEVNLKKADKLYDNLLYEDAIIEYKKAVKDDNENSKAIIRLAHCYRMLKNAKEAERWYAAAVQIKELPPANYLYYSECLIINGKFAEAERWVKKYIKMAGSDNHTNKIMQRLNNINALLEDSLNFSVKKISINSNQSDFGPMMFNNGIVFASSRERNVGNDKKAVKVDDSYYYLYFARGFEDSFKKPEIFAPTVFTKFNNGPICFNKAGNEMYVTRNNVEDEKEKTDENGEVNLKIYKYKKTKTDWNGETAFPYNSDSYSCAHAFLSADGNKLYFSSDMPGGYGKSDIYVCIKKGNKWGKPENLGPEINTEESEGYPFVDDVGGLFFSTNGRGGLGGFDIFYSKKLKEGYDTPMNLGYPINSSDDDFGWIQNEGGTYGYFTSNRNVGEKNDDIYFFNRMKALLNVLVYDSESNAPLAQSTIRVIESGKQSKVIKTTKNGYANIYMEPGKDYSLVIENDGYASDPVKLDNSGKTTTTALEIPVALNHKVKNQDTYAANKDNSEKQTGSELALANNNDATVIYKKQQSSLPKNSLERDNPANRTPVTNYSKNKPSNDESEDSEEISKALASEDESESQHSYENNEMTEDNLSAKAINTESEVKTLDKQLENPPPAKKKTINQSADLSNTKNKTGISSSENNEEQVIANSGNKQTYAMNNTKKRNTQPAVFKNATVIRLKNMYYETGKSTIRQEGIKELDIAFEILSANPEMKIELDAHTDCRETEIFNQALSEKRAQTAMNYLVKKGIKSSRIIANGYGETMLVNHCECEGNKIVPCTENQHQANRRTEIKLLSFKNE